MKHSDCVIQIAIYTDKALNAEEFIKKWFRLSSLYLIVNIFPNISFVNRRISDVT
jgi:hypothetical protein